jgi:predicted RNase H-like nuclease
MRFIGLDLAWGERNNTASAVLESIAGGVTARLVDFQERLQSDEAILHYLNSMSVNGTCIAIDAPLIVRNPTGARPVDKEITRRFGRYGAGAHPCNLRKFPQGVRGERLVKALVQQGFKHRPFISLGERRKMMRRVFEVYPHPAHVVLFRLQKRLLYKKGDVGSRRRGLVILQEKLLGELTRLKPRLRADKKLRDLLRRDVYGMKGRALKAYEDTLDSLFCAYIAFYHWYWGEEQSEVIGDMETGYIVIPKSRCRGGVSPPM